MKVGDLVKWRHHGQSWGIVLETKPLKGAIKGTAVLAWVPECPEPEWFTKGELELIDEQTRA